jgi:hypothetical protein
MAARAPSGVAVTLPQVACAEFATASKAGGGGPCAPPDDAP